MIQRLLSILIFLLTSVASGVDFNARDFGAVGNGKVKDTVAIQRALDSCAKVGGRVVLPKGIYLSGTVFLGDNTELHLEEGAILLGSSDLSDYNSPDAFPQNWGSKTEGWSACHLVLAIEKKNVAITGRGVIDGNGRAFMADRPEYFYEHWENGFIESRNHKEQARPGQEIEFVECRSIRVEDVTLRDMCCWSCFFYGCDDVRVKNVRVRTDRRYANTDGFDIDSCKNVAVTGCDIETGDDGFAIRGDSSHLKDGARFCENVLISNNICLVSASGVRVGVGRGTVRNICITDLKVRGAGVGVLVQSTYMKNGGLSISDVTFENVEIESAVKGVSVCGRTEVPGVPLERVRFKNLKIFGARRPIEVVGAGRTRPTDISFDNVMVRDAEYPFLVREAEDVTFENVDFGWGRYPNKATTVAEPSGAFVSSDTSRPAYDAAKYPELRASVPNEIGDFSALRAWLDGLGRPADATDLRHFLRRYYGSGQNHIWNYLRELYAQEINRYKDVLNVGADDPYLSPRLPSGFRARAVQLWHLAQDAAEIVDSDEPAYARHVRQSRPPLEETKREDK